MAYPTESEIQSLKAQEAKDLCIDLLNELKSKQGEPISPGEVQLQELQYELKLKEAQAEDRRLQEESEERIKELELQIEQERTAQISAEKLADQMRQKYANIIQQVNESQEKMHVQFERSSREHEVRMEMMVAAFRQKKDELELELAELNAKRDELLEEIERLTGLASSAQEIVDLNLEIENQVRDREKEQQRLQEEAESASFDARKELQDLRRQHDLELAELRAEHRKHLLETNLEALDRLLQQVGLEKIEPTELARLRNAAQQQQAKSESEIATIRESAIEEFRKLYNLNTTETLDVTELFYRCRALEEDNRLQEQRIEKLDAEIARMRAHIELESSRVAKAVEAARTNIQNTIEPGVKR